MQVDRGLPYDALSSQTKFGNIGRRSFDIVEVQLEEKACEPRQLLSRQRRGLVHLQLLICTVNQGLTAEAVAAHWVCAHVITDHLP